MNDVDLEALNSDATGPTAKRRLWNYLLSALYGYFSLIDTRILPLYARRLLYRDNTCIYEENHHVN